MNYSVYALYNVEADKMYIGQTSNISQRLTEHNEKIGNHYTANQKGNWKLIYKEEVGTRKEALIREKQLKSYQGRLFIKRLIKY